MIGFDEWCLKWGVSFDAQQDLINSVLLDKVPSNDSVVTEAGVQDLHRYEFSKNTGGVIWRNNVGAAQDYSGNFIRYGLCNDSKKLNAKVKSADGIGILPVTIEHEMVGSVLGQFVSREYKAPNWKWKGTPREKAQVNWANLVNSLGGDAKIITMTKGEKK